MTDAAQARIKELEHALATARVDAYRQSSLREAMQRDLGWAHGEKRQALEQVATLTEAQACAVCRERGLLPSKAIACYAHSTFTIHELEQQIAMLTDAHEQLKSKLHAEYETRWLQEEQDAIAATQRAEAAEAKVATLTGIVGSLRQQCDAQQRDQARLLEQIATLSEALKAVERIRRIEDV